MHSRSRLITVGFGEHEVTSLTQLYVAADEAFIDSNHGPMGFVLFACLRTRQK